MPGSDGPSSTRNRFEGRTRHAEIARSFHIVRRYEDEKRDGVSQV